MSSNVAYVKNISKWVTTRSMRKWTGFMQKISLRRRIIHLKFATIAIGMQKIKGTWTHPVSPIDK